MTDDLTPRFTIDSHVSRSTLTMVLRGELTNAVAYLPWETAVVELAQADTQITTIALDLTAVTFTDTVGLGALVRVRELADQASAACELHGLEHRTRRLLTITGLLDTFTSTG